MGTLAVTNSFSAGTTIVAADMNTNFDDVEAFVNTTPGVVQNDIVDAKGDIVAATAADAVSRLAVGTDTHALVADSGEATGLKWAVPTDSTKMPLAGGTFTGAIDGTDATFTGTTTTYLNVITDSTTTRTPGLTDAGAYILTTHGTGITVTLPQDSAVAFPVGTTIYFERNGAGTLTFAAGTGATVNSKDATLTCGDRYTTVAAVKIAADTWTLIGNIG
jgi:hypothetical protein